MVPPDCCRCQGKTAQRHRSHRSAATPPRIPAQNAAGSACSSSRHSQHIGASSCARRRCGACAPWPSGPGPGATATWGKRRRAVRGGAA